ncbi:MAG: tRNA (N(6)-L-threonylcarbamoyladenosine(37)-C(2))-methylthiotransferase MtaB [Butyricicoccus sp.]
MKFCFSTLGCKVNQFETQALAQLAQERGHTLSDTDADVCVLNTCTVTETGTKKNLREVRRLRRNNPHAVIALCGCFAQTDPERACQVEGVSIVCGTSDRQRVLELCEQAVREQRKPVCTVEPVAAVREFEPLPAGVLPGHTRALLKVQDGCDNYCTYCIIPYARGHVRSLPMEQAVQQVRTLTDKHIREIIITGIEIASYGRDLSEKPTLIQLTETLCRTAPSVRFRLGSLEPRIVTEKFCQTLSQLPNLALHFHVSLQSGCDATLQRMHRRYTTAQYAEAVARLRAAFPTCSITTDVITGFPGETDEEFTQTMEFVRSIGFSAVHVFPYSERPGTPAARMPDSVPPAIRAQRADQLRDVCRASATTFLQQFIGQTITILPERPHHGVQSGHSRWHFSVRLTEPTAPQGQELNICILGVTEDGLLGTIAQE